MSITNPRVIAFLVGLLVALFQGVVPLVEDGKLPTKEAVLAALGVAAMAYVTKYFRDATPKQVAAKLEVARADAARGARLSSTPPAPHSYSSLPVPVEPVVWDDVPELELPQEDTPLERPRGGGMQ